MGESQPPVIHLLTHQIEGNKSRKGCKLSKIRGAACFTLGPPEFGSDIGTGASGLTYRACVVVQRPSGGAGVVPLPPWMPYAPNLVTCTQWWLVEMAGTAAADLEK